MDSKQNYRLHFVALSILFVLGNACITLPVKKANQFNFLAFLVVCAVTVAAYYIVYYIPINRLTLLPVWLLAVYSVSDAFVTFVRFISSNLLPDSPRILIVLPFVGILLYIAFQRVDTLFKFSLMCGIIAVGVIILFFCSTLKDFNLENIYIYELPSALELWGQILPYIKSIFLPVVLLALFARMERVKKANVITGIIVGIICFGFCILNAVLLFGIEFSGKLNYPYSSAGSTVTFGYLFTRLDGFLYFLYLATCVTKCAVGIFVIKKSREFIP